MLGSEMDRLVRAQCLASQGHGAGFAALGREEIIFHGRQAVKYLALVAAILLGVGRPCR